MFATLMLSVLFNVAPPFPSEKTRDAAHLLRRTMGLQADGIHSDLSQSRRENIMAAFRAGVIKVLVVSWTEVNFAFSRLPTQVLKVLKGSWIDFHKFKVLKRS